MRTFDFAPFYRSTVGFDQMFSMLDQLGGVEGAVPSYPPYDIERASENAYRISVAVAGFTDADLSIETKENRLTIRGEKQTSNEQKTGEVLYQGIAGRAFERSFQLADYVKVKGASLENGLLHVELVREIPEAMKPRSIPIVSTSCPAASRAPMTLRAEAIEMSCSLERPPRTTAIRLKGSSWPSSWPGQLPSA